MKKTENMINIPLKGYKVTDENMQCQGFQYELNKIFIHNGNLKMCNAGFHYCPIAADCFNYKAFDKKNRVFEIIDHGKPIIGDDKNVTNSIELIRELSWIEVLEIVNIGKGNSGIRNAGSCNAGNCNAGSGNAGSGNAGSDNAGSDNAGSDNAGSCNAGNYNAGSDNAGSDNAGSDNAGSCNAGSCNAGSDNAGSDNAGSDNAGSGNAGSCNVGRRNAGNYNAGSCNAGNYNAGSDNAGSDNAGSGNAGNYNAGSDNAGSDNAGSYNAGRRNAGSCNAGSDNAGAFNNLENHSYMLFNKPSEWTYEDFIQSNAFKYLSQINTTLWIPKYKMTDEEKENNPSFVTTGGYIKYIDFKRAFVDSWNNWDNTIRQSFKDLPNFCPIIFKDITGVDVKKD